MKMRIVMIALLLSLVGGLKAKSSHNKAALGTLSKQSSTSKIKIIRAYHHKGAMSDKLVFYFSQRPICTYVPSALATGVNGEEVPMNEAGQVELEFFMPLTSAEKTAQRFLNQLGATQAENDLYRVQFQPDYGKGGLTCRVVFRPDEIGFQQESFEAITGDYALSFSFLKRKAVKDINNKLRPLLQTAQLKKKSILQLIADMETMIQVS